jgi:hypothetical protein
MPIARTHPVGLETKDLVMHHTGVHTDLLAGHAISANE